jgi:hypothetical protein
MGKAIVNGFPLRRCSWVFEPIVSNVQRRRMFRWLNAVCLRQGTVDSRAYWIGNIRKN